MLYQTHAGKTAIDGAANDHLWLLVGLDEDEIKANSVFGHVVVTPRSDTDSSPSNGLRFIVVSGGIYHAIAEKICEGAGKNGEMRSFRGYIMSAAQSTVKGETVSGLVTKRLLRSWEDICDGFKTFGDPMSFSEDDFPTLGRYKDALSIGSLAVGTASLDSAPPPGARSADTPRAASTSTNSAARTAAGRPLLRTATRASAHEVTADSTSGSGSITNCSTRTNAGRKKRTRRTSDEPKDSGRASTSAAVRPVRDGKSAW